MYIDGALCRMQLKIELSCPDRASRGKTRPLSGWNPATLTAALKGAVTRVLIGCGEPLDRCHVLGDVRHGLSTQWFWGLI